MAKDNRIKCCPNEACERNIDKYRYKFADMFCTKCGSELVLVCRECFSRIADEGPAHMRCKLCEAERQDRKENAKKRRAKIASDFEHKAKLTIDKTGNAMKDLADGTKTIFSKAQQVIEAKKEMKAVKTKPADDNDGKETIDS